MSSLKRLINPPIQSLLWGSGAVLLALGSWSVIGLKMLDENPDRQSGNVSVQIPDASVLDTPDMNSYPQMVEAPLFWEGRKALKQEPQAAPVAMAAPVDTTLPEGRLIGIVDNGGTLFAIMENMAGGSVHLRQGDAWGAWKVTGIDPDRLLLAVGDQQQEIPLVGDFSAPQENPQVAQARAAQQQRAQQQAQQQAARQHAPAQPMPAQAMPVTAQPPQTVQQAAMPQVAGNVPQGAGLPFPADTQKQPPALSVNEALEARQRLMASRWGALTGEGQAGQPPQPGAGQ